MSSQQEKPKGKRGIHLRQRSRQKMSTRLLLLGSGVALSLFVIGGLLIYFNFSQPGEARAAASIGDYRSVASGNWNTTTTWQIFNGISWSAAGSVPSSGGGVIEICSGHVVTVAAGKTVDHVVVDFGGTLSVNAGITLQIKDDPGTDLLVNGTLDLNGTMNTASNSIVTISNTGTYYHHSTASLTLGSSAAVNVNGTFRRDGGSMNTSSGTFNIKSGASYQHNADGGTIPTMTWSAGSTVEITGVVSTVPGGLGQNFQNLIWNSPGQTAPINLAGALSNVQGNFTVSSTGSSALYLDQQGNNSTLDIAGNMYMIGGTLFICVNGSSMVNVTNDFLVSGGNFNFNEAGGTGYGNTSGTVNVGGNLLVSGGTLDMSQYSASNSSKGIGIMTVAGNATVSGGLITESSTYASGQIYFDGTTTQNFSSTRNITQKIDYIIQSSAIVDADTSVFTGGGDFTLMSSAGLITANSGGITSSGAIGTVQVTGSRSFSPSADYTYDGTVLQNSGNGLPSQVHNLTIQNNSNVNLTSSTSIAGTMFLNAGLWIATSDTLTLGTSTSTLGTLNRTTGHVVGYFKRWLPATTASNVLFPIGTLNFYNAGNFTWTVAPTSAGSIVSTFITTNPGTNGLPIVDASDNCLSVGYAYWVFNPANSFAGGSFNLNLFATGFPGISDYTKLHIFNRTGTAAAWTNNGTHSPSTGSNTSPIAYRLGSTLYKQFGIVSGPLNALPVELVDFIASPEHEEVDLKWMTASEINNDYFSVERSGDGVTYQEIGKVLGNGNATTLHTYKFVDEEPYSGISYYRLKQVDYDGKFEYSPVRAISCGKAVATARGLSIISAQADSDIHSLNIVLSSGEETIVTVQLSNMSGQMIQNSQVHADEGRNRISIDLQNLTPGIYILTTIGKNGGADSKKIIIA